jgi:hypothetical protein
MFTRDASPNALLIRRSLAASRALTLALAIGLAMPGFRAGAQAETEGDPLDGSTMTVNVELILDASGSMSEPVPGTENQTRMEAAQTAMREVIDRIPERDGLNVGFRVYGHEGSNAEEDRPRSCRATELLVPLEGVDQAALLDQVDGFAPTGWTPLARALEAAARDFAPGGESVTNAIIMVTDGEETCGGDPCQVAAALHAADIALTTHVVGFALTEEQRQAVRCIADEGGGQLYTADDAASLADAVFAALTEVEQAPQIPAETVEMVVGGFVGGNAGAILYDGVPAELAVVAVGRMDDGDLALVIRNNTGEAVEAIGGEVIARAGGELAGVGNVQGVQPFVVEAGEYALAYGYFSGADIPPDAEFEFVLGADPAGTDEITGTRDLTVAEISGGNDGIVGILTNPHEESIAGIVITSGICFDADGAPLAYVQSTTSTDGLGPGEMLPFVIPTALSTETCPVFLAAGSGSAE